MRLPVISINVGGTDLGVMGVRAVMGVRVFVANRGKLFIRGNLFLDQSIGIDGYRSVLAETIYFS